MIARLSLFCVLIALSLATGFSAPPEKSKAPEIPGAAFQTPVKKESLDPAVYVQWADGKETVISGPKESDGPQGVIATQTTSPGSAGVIFGSTKTPGPRHLRIGFLEPVRIGSVLTRGGGSLSVLKPGAAYPGDLNNEASWLAATRLLKGEPSHAELQEGDLDLWVLPPGTSSRALRFTHTAEVTDLIYSGNLGGALVLSDRLGNVAPQALAAAGANGQLASRLNNQDHDLRGPWENQEKDKAPPEAKVISEENPEWLALTWSEPVTINGLAAVGAGFGKVEVETYTGKGIPNPKDKDPAKWQSLGVFEGVRHMHPSFWPNRLDFGKAVTTRALRLRLTAPGEASPRAGTNDGKRVWLSELLALRQLGDKALEPAKAYAAVDVPPPIPIHFTLEEGGFVTLVIEKPDGFRVRNLVSETWFPAGENTAWWDGTDDAGVDADAAMHGLYRVFGKFVEPGEYVVRGLVRGKISPHYEFSVYTTGNPPWNTPDSTGAWLANHSPPQAAVFVPAEQSPTGAPVVYLGCYVTEGPSGLAWVNIKDGRKLGGKKWIGGHWTAAPFLARDAGSKAVPGVHVYVGSAWEKEKKSEEGELRFTAITKEGDKPVLVHPLGKRSAAKGFEGEIGGIAVHDGILIASLALKNQLLFVDAKEGKVLGTAALDSPRGVAFDTKGRLLVLSGSRLLRYASIQDPAKLPAPEIVVGTGLEDPAGLTLDSRGTIYISDHGKSHQVKVFSESGKLVRTVGNAGEPKAGPYDPLHMNNPAGLAVDSDQQIWVTEDDFLPKRVSVWSQDGKLIRAFYGPAKYGGGGALDPLDKTKFYYADEGRGAMEFKLDWKEGTYTPANISYRRSPDDLELPARSGAPETALYHEGRRYFTNAYNSSPTGGYRAAFVFAERDGSLRPVAGMGEAASWDEIKTDAFLPKWPEGTDFKSNNPSKQKALFLWSDLNEDGRVQPEEVTFQNAQASGVTVMPDLSFCVARVDDKAMQFSPVGFSKTGVPTYDLARGKVLAEGVQNPGSSGGNQALAFGNGWSAITLGVKPFSPLSISGAKDGVVKWSYPSPWPGLHASHRAPRPDRPGQLIGTTRLPGGPFEVKGSDAGPFWALHSNHGRMAVFTYDGLFVANLFQDMRGGKPWRMPSAVRDMNLEEVTLGEENFWPTITSTSDGKVYLVDGSRSALVRLDGMESIQRLPNVAVTLTKADLEKCRSWQQEAEAARQSVGGDGILHVAIRKDPPVVDGTLEDWSNADWADIEKRGAKAYFNATSKPYDYSAAVAVTADRLYAAWKTGDEKLLQNSGEMPVAPFKTGGALDLMISTNPTADENRKEPVAGDQRLLVTVVGGKPKALLYRAVVAGTKVEDKVPFSSPWRTITFDRVDDVTSLIEFASKGGDYEISLPLSALDLKPEKGLKVKGDVGVLRGDGTETTTRVYWNNKATGIVSDVPDEAKLTPSLWGTWEFSD